MAVLRPTLQVRVTPPMLQHGPGSALLTFLHKADEPGVLTFETIERKGSPAWVTGLRASPAERVTIRPEPMQERRHLDPSLCLRTYRFSLAPQNLPVGTHRGTVALVTSGERADNTKPVPLEVLVVPRLAIVPNPARITLHKQQPAQQVRVTVVDRQGQEGVAVLRFDRELLSVRPVEAASRTVAFEIEPRSAPAEPVETTVTFAPEGGDPQDLVVRIEPAVAARK